MLALRARQADDDALAVVPEKLTRRAWHSRTVVGARTACNDARRARLSDNPSGLGRTLADSSGQ